MLLTTICYLFYAVLGTTGLGLYEDDFFDEIYSPVDHIFLHGHGGGSFFGRPRFGPSLPGPPSTASCGTIPNQCSVSRYRTYDGTCNNLRNPSAGTPMSAYNRLLPKNYGDGISTPTLAKSGNPLPSARVVSLAIYPDVQILDPLFTLNAMQYGQIITHDMSMIAGSTQARHHGPRCCSDDGQLLDQANIPELCFPIILPDNDPIHAPIKVKCMNFVRTITDRNRGCVGGWQPAEQLTVVNHFLDLSIVYGNTLDVNQQLRLFQRGLLRVENRNGQDWPPRSMNASQICNLDMDNGACYLTGDTRANQNPQLTILQIVFLREHNRLANELAEINPHWNDETLFQEARKINIAQHQHITYYEWLPIFLGYDHLLQAGIIWHTDEFVNDYDPNVNPTVLNEHATAAFRYFHSLIMGRLDLVTEHRSSRGSLRLSDHLNQPEVLEQGDNFDDLARGLATQCQHASDQFHDSEITQFLFREEQVFGSDLKALDIQRNRDHGLASYNDYREYCGLPRASFFSGFMDVISSDNIQSLASLYEHPDDVDLTVGGSLETHVPGTLVGPTFLCILKEQFYRTRVGDRYWYENSGPTGFSLQQLYEIRKASISRLLCDNGVNIRSMQPRGFEKVSFSNAIVPCNNLPRINLLQWKDNGKR